MAPGGEVHIAPASLEALARAVSGSRERVSPRRVDVKPYQGRGIDAASLAGVQVITNPTVLVAYRCGDVRGVVNAFAWQYVVMDSFPDFDPYSQIQLNLKRNGFPVDPYFRIRYPLAGGLATPRDLYLELVQGDLVTLEAEYYQGGTGGIVFLARLQGFEFNPELFDYSARGALGT